jgi:hypothetical protein
MGTHGRDPRARPLPAAALRSMDEICSRPPLQSADCSQLVIHHPGVPGSSRVGGTYITIIQLLTGYADPTTIRLASSIRQSSRAMPAD